MALLLARVLAAGFVGVDAVDAPRELAARLAAEAVLPPALRRPSRPPVAGSARTSKEKLKHAFKSRTGEIGARWPHLVATRAPLA